MAYDMKSIREEFKKKGIFYTPPELANFLLKYVTIEPREVYDPTCGDGGLLSVFDRHIPKFGQEINEDQIEVARNRLENFVGVCGDTLENPAFKGKKFHLIMGNPPFSIKWNPHVDERFETAPTIPTQAKADYAFLLHILHYLADDGQAIILNFPGILYRGQKEGAIRKWMVEQNYIERVVAIPPKLFTDTAISTALLVLSKSKTTTDVIFEDVELNKERMVSIDEIRDNGFILSVSNYIQKEEEKKDIDINALRNKARGLMKEHLERDIRFELAASEIDGCDDVMDYLTELKAIIEKFIKERL